MCVYSLRYTSPETEHFLVIPVETPQTAARICVARFVIKHYLEKYMNIVDCLVETVSKYRRKYISI